VIGRGYWSRLPRRVEQHGRDVHSGDAVDERVMGLCEQSKPSLGQALHQPQLPERLGAVERLREHAAGQPLELLLAAWLRQRRVADVEGGVEVRVVDPHRPSLGQRHERQPLAVAGDEMESRDDLL